MTLGKPACTRTFTHKSCTMGLVTGTATALRGFAVETGEDVLSLHGSPALRAFALSPDGNWLLVASEGSHAFVGRNGILSGWQANAEGGLSERALQRAEELADVADVRVTPPRGGISANPAAPAPHANAPSRPSDPRLPPVGAAITRKYKGRMLTVTVLVDGFEYAGERYPSLTAVAKAITGSHMNGFRFFNIEGKP